MPYRPDFIDVPTTELHVPNIVARTGCDKHDSGPGQYCHYYPGLMIKPVKGICNARAISAGVNGVIRPESLADRPTSTSGRPYRG